jgi:hypothetical protein
MTTETATPRWWQLRRRFYHWLWIIPHEPDSPHRTCRWTACPTTYGNRS